MDTNGAPQVVSLVDAQQEPAFLLLGNGAAAVPGVLRARADRPYSAIVLTSRIEPAELATALEQARDPAVPIADFGDNRGLRRDFVGRSLDLASLTEAKHHFAPIERRLTELPFRAAREERAELTILRLAYSRDTPIEARFAPDSKAIVEYPLLGITVGARRQLELLAQLDLLRRRHFTRTHVCGRCSSARLNVYEACPQCGGADLTEEPLVHHFRCGWQDAESRFAQGRLLVCPKCRRELRHLGVDYDKPGVIVVCRTCKATNSEPVVQFACLDCSAVTPSADAASTDWYHYDLTEDGIHALREGHLPAFDIGPLLEGRPRAFSAKEFRLLATENARVARRYARPFTVARFTLSNIEALRREVGSVETDITFRRAVDVIVEALRASDFVGTAGANSIVVGFPETAAAGVAPIVERIRSTIRNATAVALDLAVDVAEGDAIADMLAESRA
jgi:Thaumarchaeal output domain 1